MNSIKENVKRILSEIPEGVILVAATKTRSVEEIREAIDAGIRIIGENYVQEAEEKFKQIGRQVRWHMIGHLQRNKVEKALNIFDCIETVDSFNLAREIDKYAGKKGIIFPVLIEINSGREPQKSGVMPEDVEKLIAEISQLKNIRVEGLMTMGPLVKNPEDIRPYFKLTKGIFDKIKEKNLPNVEMKYLSMGMSDTWKIAIEEGANMVRIGTAIFGPRR
ncbi:MAG TPA: YggS family pyridoxal phosphate-dependent enzyme [bacterium]|nr:YggS family pyridoxal phosphate-dependent enzyme [bacterium]HPP30393.1 YggS family pyridoxal phosphate-dependent enzyme [bacterium]